MDYINAIKNNFNRGYFGKAMPVAGLPDDYPAWTIKRNEWYGVAVRTDNPAAFSEKFSSTRIWTLQSAEINGVTMDLLMLTCSDADLRNEFAVICSQFVDPGINGDDRKNLVASPVTWWDNWKSLLGNSASSTEVYMKIGELIVVDKLLESGEKPRWSGVESATHDVELDNRSYEVKSTISRYGYEVEISSIYQMHDAGAPLSLVFCRFERSALGKSLDDIVGSLITHGYQADKLEQSLEKSGLEKGCTARSARYKLIEMKVFPVDNTFPSLTLDSFVGGTLPVNITKVKYTVDLSGIPGRSSL